MKIKWGLIDSDERFINNFKNYIQTYHNFEIDFYVFKSASDFEQYEHVGQMDILMIAEQMLSEVEVPEGKMTKIILTLSSSVKAGQSDYSFINRFNSSKEVIEQTLNIYYENNRMAIVEESNSRPSEIRAFYSPIGGSGKTVLSIVYAKLLAKSGKKVLYLTFDQYCDLDLLIERSNNFDLTYLLASYGEGVELADEVEKIKVEDKKTGLEFIKAPAMYKDMIELEASDDPYWNWFVSALVEMEKYEIIIIDIPTDLNDKHMDILDIASSLYVVTNNGTIEKSKTLRFNDQLQTFKFYKKHSELGTLKYIVNDSKNVGTSSTYAGSDINVELSIPYDNGFKVYDPKENKVILKTDTGLGEALKKLL